MSGITSGTGLASGLDYNSLITQLLQIDARPKTLIQQRIVQLQSDQAAYLDLNSRLGALKTAAAKFRSDNIFRSAKVGSSNENALTGVASPGATIGGFSFIVDRVVSTQQALSRGFIDRNLSSVGATSVTIESAAGRVDRDTALSELNGGAGVQRGRVVVTDNGGRSTTIDLSRAATVGEVLDAFNSNTDVRVRASVEGDHLVIEDQSGVSGTLTIADAVGSTTATSLGIAGSSLNAPLDGSSIHYLGDSTSISSLNDGNGIRFSNAGGNATPDFTIKTRDGRTFAVDIGDKFDIVDGVFQKTKSAVADLGGLKQRILEETDNAVTVEYTADGRGIRLVDSSSPNGSANFEVIDLKGAAEDLGIVGSTNTDTLESQTLLAGLNTTLATNLGGGAGITDGTFNITARDGSQYNFGITTTGSVAEILQEIGDLTGGAVTAALNADGTGLILTDTTGSTSGNLIVQGAGAEALGVATEALGVASATVGGTKLQHRYVAKSTLLTSLNGSQGVGTGTFEIVGPDNRKTSIAVGTETRSIGDLIDEINRRVNGVTARINDNGDGIYIEKAAGVTGNAKISIKDTTGNVARNLNLVGTAANSTDQNFIDGSFEHTIELDAADTLDTLVSKINSTRTGVTAAVIRDASSSTPFRLKFTATQTGAAGAFSITSAGTNLNLNTISQGRNSRIFYGSDDPARAVLLESTTNTFDGVVDGLSISANAASEDPVTLSVTQDTQSIEAAVDDFVAAFNDLNGRLDRYTAYDQSTDTRGALLGDSVANSLRQELFSQLNRPATGVTSRYRYLSQVGVKLDEGGQLTVDSAKLRAALSEDPASVAELFTAKTANATETRTEISPGIFVNNTNPTGFRALGSAEQFVQFIDRYINSTSGVLTKRREAVDTEILSQNSRISTIDDRLTRRRDFLTRQFANLETTLNNLQRQQSALSSLPTGGA